MEMLCRELRSGGYIVSPQGQKVVEVETTKI